MEKFRYKVKAEDGKTLLGRIEARDERLAVEILRKQKLFVVSLTPETDRPEIPVISKWFSRVRPKHIANLTRQLSTMITAGLSVTDALSILEMQSERTIGLVVAQVRRDVEGGMSLANALQQQPQVFSRVYIALVRVGEAAGVLDTVLKRLAKNLEKEQEFRGRVKGALVYPTIVVTGMVGVGIVMMVFVIPKLMAMYRDFGAELPGATKVLIGISEFVTRFWFVFGGILILAVGAFRAWMKTKAGRLQFDLWLLRLPIIGPLRTQVVLTEFTRTLGLMVGVGISILEALRIVREALGSAVYEEAVKAATQSVEKGFPLGASLAQDPHFPPVVPQMIAVGEETGKLDEVLKRLARYFEIESGQKIKALTTSIEPLIMILLGVGVGFLVIAVILPIYNLTNQF